MSSSHSVCPVVLMGGGDRLAQHTYDTRAWAGIARNMNKYKHVPVATIVAVARSGSISKARVGRCIPWRAPIGVLLAF